MTRYFGDQARRKDRKTLVVRSVEQVFVDVYDVNTGRTQAVRHERTQLVAARDAVTLCAMNPPSPQIAMTGRSW
jgi:hypothetical protein